MIINFADLKQIRDKHKDQKIVFTGGVFDLLHLGHIEFFKTLKNTGDLLVVGAVSDERVKQLKRENRPIHNEKVRLAMVDAIKYVDYTLSTLLQASLKGLRLVESLKITLDKYQ
jgi:cytidyltransferase-like protein